MTSKIQSLELTNRIQARAEYREQLRQLVWDSFLKHELSSEEQKGIFRALIGQVEETEEWGELHTDE